MDFADRWLLLLGLVALPVALLAWRRGGRRALAVPSLAAVGGMRPTVRSRAASALPVLRVLAVVLLAIAIAGPRTGDANAVVPGQGIDIVLAIDISSSMETNLLAPDKNRLEVTKQVVRDFVKGRTNDRIGIAVFQDDALPLSPPTLDYQALDTMVAQLKSGLLPDGTGIGVGLASAVNMLQDSNAASRVVILLTDGEHNATSIRPEDAANLAAALRIRVYTIGVMNPKTSPGQSDSIDVALLRDISKRTGARYFEATSAEDLSSVYEEIGDLETSRVGRERFQRFTEYAPWFLAGAAFLIVAELALRGTWLRRAPA
jgi:Ca-activated chloride channel family protein